MESNFKLQPRTQPRTQPNPDIPSARSHRAISIMDHTSTFLSAFYLPTLFGLFGCAALWAAAVANEQSQVANQLALLSLCSGNYVGDIILFSFVPLITRRSQVVFAQSFSGTLTFSYGILQNHYTMFRGLPNTQCLRIIRLLMRRPLKN